MTESSKGVYQNGKQFTDIREIKGQENVPFEQERVVQKGGRESEDMS